MGCEYVAKEKANPQTVMSRRAQKGTAVPAGTGLGNLWANYQAKRDRFPVAAGDSRRGRQIICAVEFVLRPAKVKYVSPGIRKKYINRNRTKSIQLPDTRHRR